MSNYTAPSQIAQRQLEYFADKKVLVAGEVEDLFAVELAKHCQSVAVFTTNYGLYRQFEAYTDIQRYFGAQLEAQVDCDMLLLYWPKAKAEAQYLLAMLMDKLGVECEIVVVGENRSGVKSIEKMFAPYGQIKKYDSARRCSFYWGQCLEKAAPFNLDDWYKEYTLAVNEQNLIIRSLPGVFSHGEFDLGSQLLIDNLPSLNGRVLDFGCGAGVLGAYMATKYPQIQIEMCDISALAVESSKATLEANGLQGKVFASDVYSDIEPGLNYLISNPPFHAGLDTSYSATETLLADSPKYLKRDGELVIVANSFLRYPPIIESALGQCETTAKTNKFAIYRAKK
ncbi:16S rRNA (guanine(1207)-N(2))-methyltransferase RsmC [Vibrio sp. SCSIO 43136]|uniref:16S rRNA (guanine(1207)-N(2))-methyltransferase RsmC n=1 Tax=Vibrio sp. SCSIO 43136 TaxID=2819101 RepID=UPI00207635CF|nr:16S rRNA (guanine(1207)-N(2))-methyltransferase RsmC [Vibrio sp. SCSIO 43136]USD64794.1 16S rRNA (guanine(1207)-N(2))-methyltransferase RsmC [Vibrio sp. SCSIO 43136]